MPGVHKQSTCALTGCVAPPPPQKKKTGGLLLEVGVGAIKRKCEIFCVAFFVFCCSVFGGTRVVKGPSIMTENY
jgi:hypothetical protein